ncbi:TRAP transporter small permease [Georgenia sp. H159]|uniref:TRAP transporter small permease n=1 Tax=Georgenia sp. H159 TaxID=3076115 RepID=UPI002D7A354B|nr:TRAP transporter small permease [Georgenia sp. H159]
MLEKALRGVSIVLAIIATLSIIVLMLAIALDVTFRFTTGASVPGMLELAESCLVVAVFFGLAWAGIQGEHIAVTLVANRFGPRVNRVFDLVTWTVSTAFLAWLVYASIERARAATALGESRFGLIEWPLYPWRWVIVIGLAALLLVSLANLLRSAMGREPYGTSTVPVTVDRTLDVDDDAPDPAQTHRTAVAGTPEENRTN